MTQRSGIASSRPTPRLANSTHWFARHSVTTGQVAPKPCEAPRQLPVWRCYRGLPKEVRELADRNYVLLKSDPSHSSLHFKKVGSVWSVRVGLHYRALATEVEDDLVWFWIGSHAAESSAHQIKRQTASPRAAACGAVPRARGRVHGGPSRASSCPGGSSPHSGCPESGVIAHHAWPEMPRFVPVAKNCSSPLCRKLLTATGTSVTYTVTNHNPANIQWSRRARRRAIMALRRGLI